MTVLRCRLAAWLFRAAMAVLPAHPYKRAMMAAMAEHGRAWWAVWRAERG